MIDRHSPTWRDVLAHAEGRIADLSRRLENYLPEHETTVVRAQLRVWREVVSLPTKADRQERSAEMTDE